MKWPVQPLPALSPAGIVVQWLDLDQVDSTALDFTSLSAEETARAQRFFTSRLSTHYRTAHLFLRERLAEKTATPAHAIRYTSNAWGKPDLSARNCQFNLSHSDNLALLGIGDERPLGVDIEKFREFEPGELRSLARTIMTPTEQAEFETVLNTPRRPGQVTSQSIASQAFLTAWTRKEACVKALGLGLSFGVESLYVGLTPDTRQIVIPPDPQAGRKRSTMTLCSDQIGTRAICSLAVTDAA